MNPIVLYKLGKSTKLYVKLGNNPFSTFLLMICLTRSRAIRLIYTLFSNSFRYSSSELVSRAIRARFTVETFTEPTFNAVPPILLKYPKSSMLLFNLQQLLNEFTEVSTNKLLSDHYILCLIAQIAKSSSTNLPFCLSKLIVLTGKVNIFLCLICAITSIYHFWNSMISSS